MNLWLNLYSEFSPLVLLKTISLLDCVYVYVLIEIV